MVLLIWSQLCLRCTDKLIRCKPELLLQCLEWCRSSKGSHTNDRPLQTGVMCPAQCRGLFHCDTCCNLWREYVVMVVLALTLKQLPGWHTHHTRPDPLLLELFIGLEAESDLTPGRQEQDLRLAPVCVCQDIGPLSDARGWCVDRAVNGGQGLPREDKNGWFMMQLHDHAPGFYDFIGISRA